MAKTALPKICHRQAHPFYKVWIAMRSRCNSKTCADYPSYGGRGIKIDPSWESFDNFCRDLGPRPAGYMLERIDNNSVYSKENCRWASPLDQNRNRRSSLRYELNGETKPLIEWCRDHNQSYIRVYQRIKRKGLSLALALGLSGCASLPPFPDVWQCAYRHDKGAFYCVNTKTKAQLKLSEASGAMKGAQCVSPKDFNSVQNWITSVKEIAQERCH